MINNFKLRFLFCILLLHEFGLAIMVHHNVLKQSSRSLSNGKKAQPKSEYKKVILHEEHAEEKSGVVEAAKFAYKLLKIGAKVVPKMITLAAFGNAIFRAISGCCADYPEACEGNDKIVKLQEEIREKSMDIDAMQLEAQNLQKWAESARSKFSLLVAGMSRVVDNTEVLIRRVSPETIIAINNRTVDIKKLVREKSKAGEKVNLDTVESMYGSALGSFVDITLPLFELILPSIPKIVKFAANKFAIRQAQELNDLLENSFKDPPASSIKAVRANGWFAKTKAKISKKINVIKLKTDAKYSKAADILNKIGSGLSFLFNALSSGFELYSIINSAQTCKEKRDNVVKSLEQLTSASGQLDEILKKIKESKLAINKAWTTIRAQLSSPELIRDLKEVQKLLASVSGSRPEIESMSSMIGDYIKGIAETSDTTPHDIVYQLLEDLTTVMSQVHFAIECFGSKVQMVNYIWQECRRGSNSFENLYEKGMELFDEKAEQCKGKMGFLHVDRKSTGTALSEAARRFHFNEDCILNSHIRKEYACQLKESGYPLQEIAAKANLTTNQATFLTKQCSKPDITPTLKKAICNLKKLGMSSGKIARALKLDEKDVERMVTRMYSLLLDPKSAFTDVQDQRDDNSIWWQENGIRESFS